LRYSSAAASLVPVVVTPLDEPDAAAPLDDPVAAPPLEDDEVVVVVELPPPVPLPLAKSDEFSRHCRLTMPPCGRPLLENCSDCGHVAPPVT
jgi:hypothetical protein